ncbi:MAG: hypothetical protein IJF84_08975 [Thermoguttaceae bacterium]|nr:hypothetical protein [Thermoguttaceae bacterium]
MIHQLYITHCTYGSSYFSSAEDKASERTSVPLGYSVRSASADQETARKIFTAIESQMYYHLPSDGAASDIDAVKAPRRFFYLPSVDGKPVIGCVAYRKEDTAGRPGSYFAHVLYGDGEKPWMTRTVLQMYKSNFWRGIDGTDVPDALPTLDMGSVTPLTDGSPISDSVFENWISGKTEWKTAVNGEEIVVRPEQFEQFFAGAMSVWKDASKKIILVADSDMAALFYYGILRLAPGGWGTHAAFSTYESAPMEFPGRLCATTFVNPMKNDLSSEMYAGHFVFNVFTGRQSPPGVKPAAVFLPALPGETVQYPLSEKGECSYTKTIINRLKTSSWAGASALQQLSAAMGLKPGGNPDAVIATEFVLTHQIGLTLRLIAQGNPTDVVYLNRSFSPDVVPIWRQSHLAADLLQKQLIQGLSQIDIDETNVAEKLKPIVGTQAHLMILELLGTQSTDPKSNLVVLHLLKTLPLEQVGPWLSLGNASESAKMTMLLRHISADGVLPPDSEKTIFEGTQTALLSKLLVKLDPPRLGALWNRYVQQYRLPFIAALTQSVAYHGGDVAFLNNRVEKLTSRDLIDLFKFGSERYYAEYPAQSSAMGKKLDELSTQFEAFLPEFNDYIQTLSAGSHLMSEDKAKRANSWTSFKATAQSILEQQGDGTGNVEALDDLMKKLVTDFSVAAPDKESQERAPEKRKQFLQQIVTALFPAQDGFKQLLPPTTPRNERLWEKTVSFFEDGQWAKSKQTLGTFVERIVGSRESVVHPIKDGQSEIAAPPASAEPKKKFTLNKKQTMYLTIALGAFLLVTLLVLINLDLLFPKQDDGLFINKTNLTQLDAPSADSNVKKSAETERQKESQALKNDVKTNSVKEDDSSDVSESDDAETAQSPKTIAPIIWDDAPEYGDKYETNPEQDEVDSMADSLYAAVKKNPGIMSKLSAIPSKTDLEIASIKDSLREPMKRVQGKAFNLPTEGIASPLDENGELDLVQAGLIDSVNMPNLKLGPGFFVFQDKVVRWGAGDVFDPQNPVTQYRLTDLEKALGLDECYVSLKAEPTTVKMVLSVKGKKVHFDKNDKKKAASDLEQRQIEYKDLGYELREYNRPDVPENAKKKRVYRMGVMVGIPIAETAPEAPNKKDFKTDEEYQSAVEDHRLAVEAYERQRELIVTKANEVYGLLEKEIERLTNLEAVEQERVDAQAQKNLSEVLKYLKQSAFVLYRTGGFEGMLSLPTGELTSQPDAGDSADAQPAGSDNNDLDPFAATKPNKPVDANNAADANADSELNNPADEPLVPEVNNDAPAAEPIQPSADDDSEDEVLLDPFAEPTEKEKPQTVRIKPRRSSSSGQKEPESAKQPGAGSAPVPAAPASDAPKMNTSALMFSDDDSQESPLAGTWTQPTSKPLSITRSGVIGTLSVICRNAGATKNTQAYNKFRGTFQKNYSIECQVVQISVLGVKTPSKFVMAPSGPQAICDFDIIPQTVTCMVKFRFTNKENPEKVFETNWETIKNIESKKQYTLYYELTPGDMEMALAQ